MTENFSLKKRELALMLEQLELSLDSAKKILHTVSTKKNLSRKKPDIMPLIEAVRDISDQLQQVMWIVEDL